ncbi:MAG TPA: DUF2127 domain-containing protein [Candidatus Polarisedimenticolaceae bacterium]|nr:DUF2127 domain-containing protein [Candidatus Polarisedimenticolaceae bacterium]
MRPRTPGLWLIIAFKLVKGLLLLALAFGIYGLVDENLPQLLGQFLENVNLDPEQQFFARLADKIATVTPTQVGWLATGTLLYSLFSLVEGVGLVFRASWAGWLAVGESAFFIPIELFELVHKFTLPIALLLVLNVVIVVYLVRNRERLFHH